MALSRGWNYFYNVELVYVADEVQVGFKYMELLKFDDKPQLAWNNQSTGSSYIFVCILKIQKT